MGIEWAQLFTEALLLVLSLAFGLWAFTVRSATKQVISKMDDAQSTIKELDGHLAKFARVTEIRLVRLEAWQENYDRHHQPRRLDKSDE